jgi:hypothetical protein
MGKTNFTFVRPFLMVLLAFFGMQSLQAQDCPLVIANDATYTIPDCAGDVTVCYSFNLSGSDCDFTREDFRTEDLYFDGLKASDIDFNEGDPAADGAELEDVFFYYNEDAGQDGIFVEFCFTVSADYVRREGAYHFVNVAYDDDGDGISDEPNVLTTITFLVQQPTRDYRDLSCTGTVNVKLDRNCEAYLKASMVLNGKLVCDEDFYIEVVNVVNGRAIVSEGDGLIPSDWSCGQYIYRVYRNNDRRTIVCWGYVNAEDKTEPRIECPSDKFYGAADGTVYTFEGTLDGPDVFDPTLQTCFRSTAVAGLPTLDLLGTDRYYDLQEFKVDKSGIYTFHIFSDMDYSALAALYAGAKVTGSKPFDKYHPCDDIIAFGDYAFAPGPWSGLGDYLNILGNINGWSIFLSAIYGGQGDTDPYIRTYLEAGKSYTLLTSSTLGFDTGDYQWFITGPGKVQELSGSAFDIFDDNAELINPLICTDKELLKLPSNKCYTVDAEGEILSINGDLEAVLARTGYPHLVDTDGDGDLDGFNRFNGRVQDNCGTIEVCVSDVTRDEGGDCGVWVIYRTFTAKDECAGLRYECTQEITVRQPTLEDVVLPHYTQYISCDQTYQTVPGSTHPSPAVTGYPFVVTAFGYYDLGKDGGQTYCKLGASWVDKAEVKICDKSFTFLREWTIYDWCNPGRTIIYNQLIKVGDFDAPTAGALPQDPWDCVPTFSTGAFSCDAAFTIPTPADLKDNCSSAAPIISVDIIAYLPEYDVHGYRTGRYEESIFRAGTKPGATVTGVPKGLHLFKYTIADGCGNKTIKYYWFQVIDGQEPVAQCDDFLNVSVSGQSVDGTTRIYAKDVDEGSYDGCAEEVALTTRRTFADETCADQYSQLFFGTAFADLGFFTAAELEDIYGKDNARIPYNRYYHAYVDGYFTVDGDGNPISPVFTLEGGVLFTILGDYVDILCCDVHDSVRIELWVWDDANMNGIVGDYDYLYGSDVKGNQDGTLDYVEYSEYYKWLTDYFCPKRTEGTIDCPPSCGRVWDNHNVCWLDVLIEDKAKPVCKPPAELRYACTDPKVSYEDAFTLADSTTLDELFGEFYAIDNCEAYMEALTVTDTRNNCGVGTITRTYQAVDGWGNRSAICSQKIIIYEEHNYIIGFPADTSGTCAQIRDTSYYVQTYACDVLAVAVKDTRFVASGDECYKIERKFSVINWCEYDGISDPYVVSRDVDGNGIGGDEDIWVIRRPTRTYLDRANKKNSAGKWLQDLNPKSTTLTLPVYNDKVPAKDEEDTKTPLTDEFPDAAWNGSNGEGFWDWADAAYDKNKDGKIDISEKPGDGKNDDGSSSKDKLYAYNGSTNAGNVTTWTTGYWQYTQFIKIYDQVDPIVTSEEQEFCSYSSDFAKGCPALADVPFTVLEDCTPDDLKIKVFLDAFSNGVFDADNLLPANTLKKNFGASVTGTYPNYVISGGSYPLGEHLFEVHIVDGCGNSTVARIPFTIKDCKAPSPICINGLAVELMPVIPAADVDGDGDTDTGAMAIWAVDFADVTKISDCSGPIKLAIYRSDDTELADSTFVPDAAATGITVTCDDFNAGTAGPNGQGAGGTVLVRIYAIDAVGNFDYCETYVLVQNNLNTACGTTANPGVIAGTIATEDNKAVQGVSVQLSGEASNTASTLVDGKYGFSNLKTGYDYTVTPVKDNGYLNGVSTFDLVLISKHILGVQPLNSAYKMIAADVNNSKSITTLDLIQLRKLILSVDTEFSNNTSWRFVDASYRFPNAANPWLEEFPEVKNVNDLTVTPLNNVNFVAVKIGDVNASAAVSSLASVEDRDLNGTFNLEVANTALKAGNEYRVEVRASDLAKIQGYQATLTFDAKAVEVADLVYGIAKEENFGMSHLTEGVITTSWNGEATNDVLFTLVLKAKADTELSNVLGISSRYTVAEAYNVNSELMNVGIKFSNGVVASAGFELNQNTPNPFKGATVIGFSLPSAADASLTISDMTGKVIKLVRGSYAKGVNNITLNSNDLPAGVLTYTLQSGEFTATKKMVVVK